MSSPSTRDIVLMGLFAAVTAALGLMPRITLPLGVPITAQSMGPMLAGAVLGARRGGGALALFVLLVGLGLPLLAGGRGGLGIFAGPTGGFVLGWIPAAWVVGRLAETLADRWSVPGFGAACVIGGIGVVYAVGIPYWIAITGHAPGVVLATAVNFLPGDLVKAGLSAIVAGAVHRGYPVLNRP